MSNPAFDRFCSELDELVDRWRDKPEDDKLAVGEIVGALAFKSHLLIVEAQDHGTKEEPI